MAKVSIIVPTYNVEGYLEQCLDSIVNQTLKDIEIICINDGSTDNSLKILQKYAKNDSRIKIIDKENTGYGNSMNVGLDNATGEYIGIVEPDDYVSLDMYEVLYNKAIELQLDLIKADFYRFTGENETFEKFYNKLDKSEKYYNKVINPRDNIDIFNLIMNTWSGIYSRKFIETYHIRHNETPGASFQDNGFWFQTFMRATRVYFLDKPFYMNRRDNENSSVKNKGKVYSIPKEYAFIYDYICKDSDLKKVFSGIYFLKKFKNYMFNYYRIDNSFKKEFLELFSKEFKEHYGQGLLDLSLFDKNSKRNLFMIMNKPQKFYNKSLNKRSLIEQIFSIKNDNGYKYLTIFGIRIKLKKNNKTSIGMRTKD